MNRLDGFDTEDLVFAVDAKSIDFFAFCDRTHNAGLSSPFPVREIVSIAKSNF